MTHSLLVSDLWLDVLALRNGRPLVHSITNLVVMNFNANALLAMGASPVMAHAHEEVADMAALAQALVLNIGTLEPYWIDSMCQALAVAQQRGTPTVLDPVGAGATSYRNQSITCILQHAMPSVIRGNASEIMSVAGSAVQTRGVDSGAAVDAAISAARDLARASGGVVCVSGAIDQVLDAGGRHVSLANGHRG
jgi:hydroxyethylthiazole kinase